MAKQDAKPVHPGKILREQFMKPLNLSQYRLAKELGISPIRVNQIIHETRAITADTAIRLGCLFNMDASFWMNLQSQYDLEEALKATYADIQQRVKPLNLKPNKAAPAKTTKTKARKKPHIATRYARPKTAETSLAVLPDFSTLMKKIDRFTLNLTVDKKPRK
jgi:addiction module HigA family antidote